MVSDMTELIIKVLPVLIPKDADTFEGFKTGFLFFKLFVWPT